MGGYVLDVIRKPFLSVVCHGENVLAPSASFCHGFWKTNCRLASVSVAGLLC